MGTRAQDAEVVRVEAPAPDGRGARSVARGLLDPSHLVAIPLIPLLLVARQHHMMASVAPWVVIGGYVVVHFSAVLFVAVFPPGTSRAKPVACLAVLIGPPFAFLYAIGWGSILGLTIIGGAAIVVSEDGSRHVRAAIAMVCAAMLAGETAAAFGLVKSLLPLPTSHLIASIEAGVAAGLLARLARGQRELERSEARRRATEERFCALVQHASDAIMIIEDGGTVAYASPAVERLLLLPPSEVIRFDLHWIADDHVEEVAMLFEGLRKQPGAVATLDVPIVRPDGTTKWFEIHVTNLTENPAVAGFVCNLRDIGDRHLAQQRLAHDALHDALTQLPNRRCLVERFEQRCREATSTDMIGVLFLDVDNFKQINDQFGHAAGDHVLTSIAEHLSAAVRPRDVVARFAGDEFVVLLNELTCIDDAVEIAERIAADLMGTPARSLDGYDIPVSVSIGIATSFGSDESACELIRHADAAMYRAKESGRGKYELFDHRDDQLQGVSGRRR